MKKGRLAAAAAATVVTALGAWVAAPALAIRPATPDEAAAIQRDLGLAKCHWLAGVSTVDSMWAHIEADPAECAAVVSLHTTAHLDSGRWIGAPWTADVELLCPEDEEISPVVAGDLGLCVGPPAFAVRLACDDRRTGTVVYRPKPRRCAIAAASEAYGRVINLRNLHWRAWDRRTARGWGAEVNEPVSIRAWRIRRICGDPGGSKAYTRLRISSDRGAVTVRRKVC